MQAIRQWFLQPYPFEARWLSGLRNGFWAGLFVTFFLFFFKPFGTYAAPGTEWRFLAVCVAFGLITFVITLTINGFCLFFPKIFNEEKWIVGKEILFNLLFIGCIGLGNLLFANVLWDVPLNGRTFWGWQGFTFGVGIFPTFFGVFLGQMKRSKRYGAEAAKLPLNPASADSAKDLPGNPIVFVGENQNETLTLQATQIAYLAAQDNYVQVFFFENGALKTRMLRATLRKMEDALTDWPQFFRCHRTYVVNFDKIEQVSGNAQGYRLHLAGLEETIPVSRNLNEVVRARMTR